MRNYVTTFDPFFDLFFHTSERNNQNYIMDTDVLDKKDNYEMRINIGNAKKENIKLSLNNGYLTVEVKTESDFDDKEEYILKERRSSSYERSYFVGEYVKMSDITAKLENNTLFVFVRKISEEEINKDKYIQIQ